MADIGTIRNLLRRALNSAEAPRRLRGHAGRYPTTRVQHWLHTSIDGHQRPHDDVPWRRCGCPDRQSRQAGDGATGNSLGELESPCSQSSATANRDGAKGREKKLKS